MKHDSITTNTTNTMDTKKTTVSNVKVRYIRPRYQDLKEWMEDDGNEYIGRAGIVFVNGERFPKKASEWANPFKVKKEGRDICLIEYEAYLREKLTRPELLEKFKKLKGMNLGCWCKPEACHGDVIFRLIEEL